LIRSQGIALIGLGLSLRLAVQKGAEVKETPFYCKPKGAAKTLSKHGPAEGRLRIGQQNLSGFRSSSKKRRALVFVADNLRDPVHKHMIVLPQLRAQVEWDKICEGSRVDGDGRRATVVGSDVPLDREDLERRAGWPYYREADSRNECHERKVQSRTSDGAARATSAENVNRFFGRVT
jgi:hypothetical protein